MGVCVWRVVRGQGVGVERMYVNMSGCICLCV